MALSTAFTPLGKADPESTRTCFFMMNNLLYSRMESGFPSNDEYFDEDVNVYIADLLTSLIQPEHHENLLKYVVPYDLSLFEKFDGENDPRMKFNAYRTNADFLLLSLGLFDNPKRVRPNSAVHMKMSPLSYIGRGKTYYSLAQSYLVQATCKQSAMADVMGKLSRGFEKYVKILSVLRSEYFNIIGRISDGELFHLENSAREEENSREIGSLYDEFLDAYSEYKKSGSDIARQAVDDAVEKLRAHDPSFNFNLDESAHG